MKLVCLNHLLAMLDKLKRSNIRLIGFCCLMLMVSSCSKDVYRQTNVEIICPDGLRVFIKYIDLKSVMQAIDRAKREHEEFPSLKSTNLRFPDRRSFQVKNVKPDWMAQCVLNEYATGQIDWAYVYRNSDAVY